MWPRLFVIQKYVFKKKHRYFEPPLGAQEHTVAYSGFHGGGKFSLAVNFYTRGQTPFSYFVQWPKLIFGQRGVAWPNVPRPKYVAVNPPHPRNRQFRLELSLHSSSLVFARWQNQNAQSTLGVVIYHRTVYCSFRGC